MKEGIKGHIDNYFSIYRGKEAWLRDMPEETHTIVYQYLDTGEAVGQYVLPGLRPEGDMRITMPQRVKEREQGIEQKLMDVRRKLAHELDYK